MTERFDRLKAFIGKSDKRFGDGKVTFVSEAKGINISRFSTGVFDLDMCLGGGWPWGRIVLIHGPESSGKTTLATMACASVQKLAASTRRKATGEEERCRALYVDQESVMDEAWAITLGMDTKHHVIARPEVGEEAIDLIASALLEEIFDLVILDSIAAMTPSKELEDSADSSHPGLQARMMNQAFRKWQPILTKLGDKAPTLMLINQEREKIGVMYGNPMTIPGGKAQLFYPSIRLKLSPAKTEDGEDKTTALVAFKGSTYKNKTFTQRLETTFTLAVKDTDIWKKGQFTNAEDLYKTAKKLDLCGHNWNTGRSVMVEAGGIKIPKEEIITVSKDAEMIDLLNKTPELLEILWKTTLKKALES